MATKVRKAAFAPLTSPGREADTPSPSSVTVGVTFVTVAGRLVDAAGADEAVEAGAGGGVAAGATVVGLGTGASLVTMALVPWARPACVLTTACALLTAWAGA
ncbi:hypothetical protein DB354_16255 [Opitutus sp. ER46]|nr:hypothetical protein DB354_16255 [Opitutus sp. ER46]